MIQQKDLDKIDKSGMYKIYDSWPEIAEETYYNRCVRQNDIEKTSHIIFAGMGGSGAISDVFASILSKTNIHVEVVKGYILPKTASKKTLVVTTSVSGNTVETLNVLSEAKKRNCKIIAFSNGGKMKIFCEKESIDFRKIIKVHSPRASFVSFLFGMLKELENILPINKKEILESIEELKKTRESIGSKNLNHTNIAINLANEIKNTPIIYYPWGLQAASIRFKNSLQENSKIHVITEDIIEASHNGIVAWKNNDIKKSILIQGKDDFIKTKERWDVIRNFLKKIILNIKKFFQ